MYGGQPLNACLIDTFHTANPQFQIGVHWVFNQHRHIHSAQTIGQSLHRKGVSRRACANPQNVNSMFKAQFHVFGCGHFGGNEHARFLLYTF